MKEIGSMNKEHYDEEYFADKDSLPQHILMTLEEIIESNKYANILEIGCGTGRLLKALMKNGRAVAGCDISLDAAKRAEAIVANAEMLPYKEGSFDLLIGISVIEHLREEDAKRFFDEAKRLLRKGGALFLVTPNFSSPMRTIKGDKWFGYSDPTHVKFYTPESLDYKLAENGFINIETTFKLKDYPDFDWGLPFKVPRFLSRFFSWLLISTPLALFRDSFWIMAKVR
ncbi:class I SAM-dependent methyltransferase [Candidatus Auribacterota bacterium]